MKNCFRYLTILVFLSLSTFAQSNDDETPPCEQEVEYYENWDDCSSHKEDGYHENEEELEDDEVDRDEGEEDNEER